MLEAILVKENIVHLGALLYCVGFLCRDQILLRAFIIAGDIVYVLYFFFAPEAPLWGGIFWSGVFTLVNVWMITQIVTDRTRFRMSAEEDRLLRLLDPLSPGEFRRLMKLGTWHSAEVSTVLTEEGNPVDRLHFVLDGAIAIDKAGDRFTVAAETFIGEVAFVLRRPASATVTVASGARYVTWDIGALRRLLLRAPSLAIALGSALNRDMAGKVARA